MDQCCCLSRRQLDIPEQNHGWGFRTSLGEQTVQVAVERNADAVFHHRMCQNLIVRCGPEASFAYVNYIESTGAEQDCQLGGKILVKKQPKH